MGVTARFAIVMTTVAVGVSGCGAGRDDAHAGLRASGSDASALKVIERPVPRLRVPRYRTRGSWPQVAAAGSDDHLRRVNAALFKVLRDEQRRYARFARKEARGSRTPRSYTGTFAMSPRRDLISASTVVVSAMVAE